MRKTQSKLLNGLVKSGYFVAVFATMFALGFFSASHFMPVSESQAEEAGPRYANIATSGKVELALNSSPGGVAKVGKDTLTVDTNAQTEYRLYISTVKDAGDGLYLEGDSSKYVSPSTGKLANPTKLAVNTWGFAQSRATSEDEIKTYTDADADHETGKAAFVGIPEYGSEKLLYVNTTPTVAATNSLDVYYGMSASMALPAGTYSNTVVYTAIVDESTSGSPKMTITPNSQLGPAPGQKVTIATDIYPNMELSDLGDIDVYIGNSKCKNVIPTIATDGSIKISCNVPKGRGEQDIKVFFRKFDKKQVLSKGYTYEIPSYISNYDCSKISVGESIWLNDMRDESDEGNTRYTYYHVAKLKDGRCWITDSLDIKESNLDAGAKSSWDDSDVLSETSFTLASPSDDAWCTSEDSACYDESLAAKNGSYGNYYNWYSATAGTGRYDRASGDAGSSICPAGWHLPTKADYDNLLTNYGPATELITGPANFVLGGKRNGGTNEEQGAVGYYWSATSSEVGKAYALKITDSTVETTSLEGNLGAAVRCIDLRETMQDFTPPVGALIGDTKTLYDARATSRSPRIRYHVAKLNDGKWWMLGDMIDIGSYSDVVLTPADTDVTSDFTLSRYNNDSWCTNDTASCNNQIRWAMDSWYGYSQYAYSSYDYLYNWYTATAGTGTYEMTSGNATASICPKGWTLPTGGSSNSDFAALSVAYGGPSSDAESGQGSVISALKTKPIPGFTNTGVHDSTFKAQDEVLLWSRTALDNTRAAYLNLTDGGRLFVSGSWGNKYKGFGIRCIRKADSV